MIEWRFSYSYFVDKARVSSYFAKPTDVKLHIDNIIGEFCEKYNCTMISTCSMTCTEEDLLMIKLCCPDIIYNKENTYYGQEH